MKIKEIKELSSDELKTRKRELQHESVNLRIQQASGQLEKTSVLRELRRDVARIETVLSDRRNNSQTA